MLGCSESSSKTPFNFIGSVDRFIVNEGRATAPGANQRVKRLAGIRKETSLKTIRMSITKKINFVPQKLISE